MADIRRVRAEEIDLGSMIIHQGQTMIWGGQCVCTYEPSIAHYQAHIIVKGEMHTMFFLPGQKFEVPNQTKCPVSEPTAGQLVLTPSRNGNRASLVQVRYVGQGFVVYWVLESNDLCVGSEYVMYSRDGAAMFEAYRRLEEPRGVSDVWVNVNDDEAGSVSSWVSADQADFNAFPSRSWRFPLDRSRGVRCDGKDVL